MDTILGIIAFVIILGLIIMVHEGGHFFFARRVDILCREFAFGMGPKLLSKKKGETTYSLRAFPIGGFCAIAGEEEEADPLKDLSEVRLEIVEGVVKGIYLPSAVNQTFPMYKIGEYDLFDATDSGNLYINVINEDESVTTYPVDKCCYFYERKEQIQNAPHNRTLNAKRKRDRAMVMFGGPLMNFILGLVVFFIAGLIQGAPNTKATIVSDMEEETPAYVAGIRNGDAITKMCSNGVCAEIEKWADISTFMSNYSSSEYNYPITITYKRGEEELTGVVYPYTICYSAGFTDDFTFTTLLFNVSKIEDNSKIIKLSSGAISYDLLVDGDGSYYSFNKESGLVYLSDDSGKHQDFGKTVAFINDYLNSGLTSDIKITYKTGNETKEVDVKASDLFYSNGNKFTSPKFIIAGYSLYDRKSGNNTELKPNDIIVAINGEEVQCSSDIYNTFNDYVGKDREKISLVVNRDGGEVEISIQPYSKKLMESQASTSGDTYPSIKNVIGVSPEYKFNLGQSFVYSGKRSLSSATVVVKTLGLLFSGGASIKDMSGPVGIFSLTKAAATQGIVALLNLTGLLSINIGIMNLLPIPALDGGRLVFVAYEAITKKKPNQKVETILITVTMLLLFGLMIYITFGDITNLLKSCRG